MALIGTRFLFLSTSMALGCGGTTLDGGPSVGHGKGTGGGGGTEVGTGGRGSGGDGGHSTGGSGAGGSGGKSTVVENQRVKGEQCDDERGISNPPKLPAGVDAGTYPYLCTSDAECTNGKNGRCSGNSHDAWECNYDECFTDADCHRTVDGGTESGVCACNGGSHSDNNVCLYSGNCVVDADCGPPAKGFCSPSFGSCGNYTGVIGYFCHKPEDACTNDADCGATGNFNGPYCAYNPTVGHFACSSTNCVG